MRRFRQSIRAVLAAALASAAWSPAAFAQGDIPTFTLNKEAFNGARAVELSTPSRQKLFADYSTLWRGINHDGVVDDAEMAFLQSQIDGAPQVRLKPVSTADWSPQDFVFNGNWSQVGGGGFDAPQVYIRARVAGWIAGKTPVAELVGKWPELTVNAALFSALKESDPAAQQPKDITFGVSLRTYMGRAQLDLAEQGRIAEAFASGPIVILVRSEAGGEPFAFANVWAQFGRLELQKMRPDADLIPLWTGAPADFVKLVEPASKSPAEFERVTGFMARQLAPLAAESTPSNAWQPLRAYVARAGVAIRTDIPEAQRPAARQLLHDGIKRVTETMTPTPSSVLYTFALRE